MKEKIEQSTLSGSQNLSFHKQYVNREEFDDLYSHFKSKYAEKEDIAIADFGGGNGAFCDLMIEAYDNSIVYNIDISDDLLKLNKPNARKRIVCESLFNFELDRKIDIVCLNYVLHHLVSSTRRKSIDLIERAFRHAHYSLSSNGSMLIFENLLYGHTNMKLSSAMLYWGTSSKLLANITRWLGANTAGVGVYYMGKDELVEIAADNGFKLDHMFGYRRPRKSFKLWPVLASEIRREGLIFSKIS